MRFLKTFYLVSWIILLHIISVSSERKDNENKETMKIFLHNFLETESYEQLSSKELSHLLASNDDLKELTENDEEIECDIPCKNDGICQAGKCFCKNPFIGPSCEFKLNLEERINTSVFYLIGLICVFVGIFFAFLFKFFLGLCFDKTEANEEKLGEREVWFKE